MIQYGCAHRAFISNSEQLYQYVQMKTQTFSMYTDMNSSQKRRLQEMTSLNSVDKYCEYNWHNFFLAASLVDLWLY
jgi:hypothetical protein